MVQESAIQLSHRAFLASDRDYELAAGAVNLVYIRDTEPGISRRRRGKGFSYVFGKRPVREKKVIQRIRSLAIPPAWEHVWICRLDNGHIQATGLDIRKRKQYRYHPLWNTLRNETKFHRLYEFGKALPPLRQRLEKDLALPELTQNRVLATVIKLMESTYIRVGNAEYEKLNGSYGLTTMKDKHVSIEKDQIVFTFTGKKGIPHRVTLKNRKLARAVKECRDIPGKELFQYYDLDGSRKPIDSGMVNDYIREATGGFFTAKDFRTWAGSLHAIQAFRSIGEGDSDTQIRKNVLAMLDEVSSKLGNTRTVCKKYYVHPRLIVLYEDRKLSPMLEPCLDGPIEKTGLTREEEILMQVLKKQ